MAFPYRQCILRGRRPSGFSSSFRYDLLDLSTARQERHSLRPSVQGLARDESLTFVSAMLDQPAKVNLDTEATPTETLQRTASGDATCHEAMAFELGCDLIARRAAGFGGRVDVVVAGAAEGSLRSELG